MQARSNAEERDRRQAAREASIFTREPLLLLGVILVTLYFGRPLLIPLALALTFNFLFAPLVSWLEQLHFRRVPAALLVLGMVTALLAGFVWLVAGQLLAVVNDLPSHAPNIRAKLTRTHVPPNSSLGQAVTSIEGLAREFSTDPAEQDEQTRTLATTAAARVRTAAGREAARRAALTGEKADQPQPTPVVIVQAPGSEFAYLRELARPVLVPLSTAGMVIIFAVYMLIKREDLRNRLLLLAGISRLNLVSHALDDAGQRISRYLIANVSVNVGFGTVYAAGLYAIGIPHATLWGALLGLLRIIPYVGTLVGGGLPVLFALIYFPAWWQAGCVLVLLLLLEILVGNFLEPWLYGARTGISALALLGMAVAWTVLWGWPGLALSTPLTVCLIVVGRTMPQMSFLHVLLGDDAELAPEARFYERMLATDQAEAHSLAERFLNGGGASRTTLELYDTVLLPALALAESDRHKGALEEHRASFFMQSLSELVAELTTYAAKTTAAGKGGAAGEVLEDALLARTCCPVVCVPANDQADEIAATMLAQLLETSGHKTLLLPSSALTPELLARFAEEPHTTLCISALPPFAFTSARLLYQKLRAELPRNPVVIGLWRSQTASELLEQRFGMAGDRDSVATSLGGALDIINGRDRILSLAEAGDIYARSAAPSTVASR